MVTAIAVTPLTRLLLARRQRVRSAYADAGWPVVSGSWWVGDRYRCGAPRCTVAGLHAVCDSTVAGPRGAGAVEGPDVSVEGRFPRSLLLVTGAAVDVVELPATALGVAAEAARWGVAVARLPAGRLLLFAGSGRLDPGVWPPEIRRFDGVLVHGAGSLVPLPPSQLRGGPVRWRTRQRLAVGELMPVADLLGRVLPLLPAAWPGSGLRPVGASAPVPCAGPGGAR